MSRTALYFRRVIAVSSNCLDSTLVAVNRTFLKLEHRSRTLAELVHVVAWIAFPFVVMACPPFAFMS